MMYLREARIRAGLTQAEISKKIGLSQNQYSNWETGKAKIDSRQILRLSEILGVSVNYLLGKESPAPEASGGVVRIPVLGTVAAGIPIYAIEEIVDYEELDEVATHSGDFFGLRIKGRSMEPRILEGDTVIVRRQDDVDSGDIAIVLVNGEEGTCKRVIKHSGGALSLIALNPVAYEPHFYTAEEVRSLPITIAGKVVELRGKF